MESQRAVRGGSTGYVIVLCGAVTFVMGCFLPYFDYSGTSPPRSASFYRLMMFGPSGPEARVGALLILFAGVVTIAWISVAGLRGDRKWTPTALAAVSIVWSLTWIGTLLGASGFGSPRLMGHWVILIGVGLVVVGTILVWLSVRTDVSEQQMTAA